MLSKQNRLDRVGVKKTFEIGSFFRGKACIARSLPSSEVHIAVSVPKKVAKTAVTRNRLRRKVYQLAGKHPLFNSLHHDVVFSLNKVDIGSIAEDIDICFSQLTK